MSEEPLSTRGYPCEQIHKSIIGLLPGKHAKSQQSLLVTLHPSPLSGAGLHVLIAIQTPRTPFFSVCLGGLVWSTRSMERVETFEEIA